MGYTLLNGLTLVGGLGLFIFGIKLMSEGLQKVASSRFRRALDVISMNRWRGLLSGLSITALVQSSSATTVMVVSMVNAKLLRLRQAVAIIMGANVGTTVTGWFLLLPMAGLRIQISTVALPIIGLAVPLLFAGVRRWKSLAETLIGFGLLFLGLETMKVAFPNFIDNPTPLAFLDSMTGFGFGSVLIFLAIGAAITVVVQSSSVAMSLTFVLVSAGWLEFEHAAAMILGENVGTTITAYLASLVGNANARRAAFAHFFFNVMGLIWVLALYFPILRLIDWMTTWMLNTSVSLFDDDTQVRGELIPFGLAMFHTLFNVSNALLQIGFVPQITQLSASIISGKGKRSRSDIYMIGRNLIDTPELAIVEAQGQLARLGLRVEKMYSQSTGLFGELEPEHRTKLSQKVDKGEEKVDLMEHRISSFLVDISQSNLSDRSGSHIIHLLEVVKELERVGDLSHKLARLARRKDIHGVTFEDIRARNLRRMMILVGEVLHWMNDHLKAGQSALALTEVRELEFEVNNLRDEMAREKHRYPDPETWELTLEASLLYREIADVLESISDHAYRVHELINETR